MALSFVDADVQWDSDPSVSYIAGDWVFWVGIIGGNTPTGTLVTMSLTSSGGGSMSVFNNSNLVQKRGNLAYMKATASGTSTWSYTTTGNVGTFFHRGAFVLRGVPSADTPILFYLNAVDQSPSESASPWYDTITSFGASFALLGNFAAMVNADIAGYAGLTFDGLTPSDITDSALHQTPGAPSLGVHNAVDVAGDIGANASWTMQHSVSAPPATPYGTSRHMTVYVFGFTTEEVQAYWGINASAM